MKKTNNYILPVHLIFLVLTFFYIYAIFAKINTIFTNIPNKSLGFYKSRGGGENFREVFMYWSLLVLPFILTISLTPLVIKECKKYSIYDIPNKRSQHTTPIPRLGGLVFVSAAILTSLLYFFLKRQINENRIIEFFALTSVIFIFGVLDDFLNLKAMLKFVIQIAVGLAAVFFGFKWTTFAGIALPAYISGPLSFFIIITLINAYNLIDGIDGLCGGLCLLYLIPVSIFSFKIDNITSIVCLMFISSILGFLVYNKPKASIFMGDGGSQTIGFITATLPLLNFNSESCSIPLEIELLLCSLPIFDLIAAIWRRLRDHKGIFSADKMHLHHKLQNIGLTPKKNLLLLLGIQAILDSVVLISLSLKSGFSYIFIITGYIFMIAFFTVVHIMNRKACKNKHIPYGKSVNP